MKANGNNYATYIRVSTKSQGNSGLGMESQRKMCEDFIKSKGGTSLHEFSDIESGTHRDRKGLWDAIDFCKSNGCGLVIAKLDRLARDVEFTFKVINTGIEIHFADMPVVNSMILGVFASVAQYERELISQRTTKALAAKKSRGCKLGAASENYIRTYNNKTKQQIEEESMKRGETKNARYLQKRDTQAMLKILKNVFPEQTKDESPEYWDWSEISPKGGLGCAILKMMRDYKEIDNTGSLFIKWDLSDITDATTKKKLFNHIQVLRSSVLRKQQGSRQYNF